MKKYIENIKLDLENILNICEEEKEFSKNKEVRSLANDILEKYNYIECDEYFDAIEALAKHYLKKRSSYKYLSTKITRLSNISEKISNFYLNNDNEEISELAHGFHYWIEEEMMWFCTIDCLDSFSSILDRYNDLKDATKNTLEECNKLLNIL